MQEAYQRKIGDWHFYWKKVELTGMCKRVSGGPYGDRFYRQVQRRLFGIPVWKSWIPEDEISFFDKQKVAVYRCDCDSSEDDDEDFEID
jgi:hypothetical protein